MNDHLVLSRIRSEGGELCVWYRASSQGYTASLMEAGRFTKEQAKRIEKSTHGDCVAIPVAFAMAKNPVLVLNFDINDPAWLPEKL